MYRYNTSLYPKVDTAAFKLKLVGKKSDPCDEDEGDLISGDAEVRRRAADGYRSKSFG